MSRELEELAELLGVSSLPTPLPIMVAGSNGAGKSTFYDAYLESLSLPFINADLIAAELRTGVRKAPRHLADLPDDEAAQRIADEERHASIVLGRSFVTETVLPDPVGAKVGMLKDARDRGFEVWLFFIRISSAELSRARVRDRVTSRGGTAYPPRKSTRASRGPSRIYQGLSKPHQSQSCSTTTSRSSRFASSPCSRTELSCARRSSSRLGPKA